MSHPSRLAKCLGLLLLVALIPVSFNACSSTTDSGPGATTKVDTTLKVVITSNDSAVRYARPGETVHMQFMVTAGGLPIDSVYLDAQDVTDPSQAHSLRAGPSDRSGKIEFDEVLSQSAQSGVYHFNWTGTRLLRRDSLGTHRYEISDVFTRTLVIDGRSAINMRLSAHSEGPDHIGVLWERSPADQEPDTLFVEQGGQIINTILAPTPQNVVSVGGLEVGVPYTFYVHTRLTTSERITWATSQTFGPIRLYETSDGTPGHFSGLRLSDGQALSVAAGAPDRNQVDIILATDPSALSGLSIISPAISSLSGIPDGKATQFSDFPVYAGGGLADVFLSQDLSHKFDSLRNAMDLEPGMHANLIFQVKTSDNHYAQVEVIPQSNQKLFGGQLDQLYVDVRVSYQPVSNLPYAERGRRKPGSTKNPARP